MATDLHGQSSKGFPSNGCLLTVVVAALYSTSLVSTCLDGGIPDDFEFGLQVGFGLLLFGHSGGNNLIPWSANIFLFIGVFCLGLKKVGAAFWFGLIATVLGLTTQLMKPGYHLLIGYYLWQSSLFALAAG